MRAFINPQRGQYEILAMVDVLTHAHALLEPELKAQGATLRLLLEDAGARVRGDRVLLEQVLVNLVHNALQAMQDQPRHRRTIELACRRSEGGLRIGVADQGPGIPAGQLDQVFSPFFTTKPDGLGLGLNICRSIVEAHGGAIGVENRPGGGATFSFTLPIVP